MKDEKETTSVLDDLIQTLRDGEEGFKQASQAVRDPQLKSLFTEYSQQRSRFATDLQSQVRGLGRKPETDSSAFSDRMRCMFFFANTDCRAIVKILREKGGGLFGYTDL
jgi:uncharacterized protein (TIGR02284 family)